MNVQNIGQRSYLITVSARELGEKAEDFSKADAEKLLGQLGHNGGKNYRFDVYPGRDEVMIFVRAGEGRTQLWEFDSLDDVMDALEKPVSMCDSQLWQYGERYILALTPWEGDPVPTALCEFGWLINVSPELAAHIREQSEILIESRAAESLAHSTI